MSTEKKRQGFASLPPEKHLEVSSKGGRSVGKPKGYATLTPEERVANASKASKARWAKQKAERSANEQI
jgi:hypothetical protein